MRREDIAELVQEIARLKDRPELPRDVVDALDTVRNCLQNIYGELDELDARIDRRATRRGTRIPTMGSSRSILPICDCLDGGGDMHVHLPETEARVSRCVCGLPLSHASICAPPSSCPACGRDSEAAQAERIDELRREIERREEYLDAAEQRIRKLEVALRAVADLLRKPKHPHDLAESALAVLDGALAETHDPRSTKGAAL